MSADAYITSAGNPNTSTGVPTFHGPAFPCKECARLRSELGDAAIELVRLRAEVIQLRHELRRSQVRESGLAGAVTAAADLGRVRVEVVREMCKGGSGDE